MKYKFLCYNNGSGTVAIADSVEVVVVATSEERALQMVKMAVNRDVYKLITVEV